MEERRAAPAAAKITPDVKSSNAQTFLAALPKAELHLHLEGSIEPGTVVELAARHGVTLTSDHAAAHYAYRDFVGFLEAFKWVTSFLRAPADYALITERLAEQLLAQNVVYAEVTLSVGVMLRRKQDVEANFQAICEASRRAAPKGIRLQFIFDATRQFGLAAAMVVARLTAQMKNEGVVAFGMGGDELAVPAAEFRGAYDFAAGASLHRLAHAGEIGGPESIREAVEILGAERIGHGIAAMHDEGVMDLLIARGVPLELCPTSNLCTGALARQLGRASATAQDHPLKQFVARGLNVALSTDDPAMFQTRLLGEYDFGYRQGLELRQLARIVEAGFEFAFVPNDEKQRLLEAFRDRRKSLGLV